MKCYLITSTGWSPDEVDDLQYAFAEELMDYWVDHPPVSLLLRKIAGAFGLKMPTRRHVLGSRNEKLPFGKASLNSDEEALLLTAETTKYAELPESVRKAIEAGIK